jgi:hypothetical protein
MNEITPVRLALQRMYDDVFDHLGIEVEYKPKTSAAFKTLALIKEPENVYEVGSSNVVGQVAEISVKVADLKMPMVGDVIFIGNKKYKICEDPLLDASNVIWKFNAVLVEK